MNSVVELAATVSGSFTLPSTEKELSEVFRLETTTSDELEFTSVTLEFAELPTVTEPKSIESGTALKDPCAGVPEEILVFRLLPHPIIAAPSARLNSAPVKAAGFPLKYEIRLEDEEAKGYALCE